MLCTRSVLFTEAVSCRPWHLELNAETCQPGDNRWCDWTDAWEPSGHCGPL